MVDYCLRPNISILRQITISLAILILAAWTVYPSSAAADRNDHGLRIDSAEWKNETHTLSVQGKGPRRTTITIKDDFTGESVGSTKSRWSGEWSFEASLSDALCRIRAEAKGDQAKSTVSGVPSNCGESQPPSPIFSGLSINGPSSLNEGTSASFTAVATYQDGTSAQVTPTWSENSSYAGISSSGVLTANTVTSNQPVRITASYTSGGVTRTATKDVTIVNVNTSPTLSGLSINGPSSLNEGTSASFVAVASYQDGTSAQVTPTWSENSSYAGISSSGVLTANTVTSNQTVRITASYTTGGVTRTATKDVTIVSGTASGPAKSITSTSQNSDTLPFAAVPEQPFVNLPDFAILAINDLGMHCGDLDHRIASILPPFNVLHAVVVQKGNSNSPPRILTPAEVEVYYSAASNPDDPALRLQPSAPIFKTNFWDPNPANSSSIIAFDAYDPFYPPNVLSPIVLNADNGLPSPDLAALYPVSGAGELIAYLLSPELFEPESPEICDLNNIFWKCLKMGGRKCFGNRARIFNC